MAGHGQKRNRVRRAPFEVAQPAPAGASATATPLQDVINPLFFSEPAPMMTHTQSRTWKSKDAQERDQFARLSSNLCRFVPDSSVTPKTYFDWLAHRAAMNELAKEDIIRSIEIRLARKIPEAQIPLDSVFAGGNGPDGKPFTHNRSAVLSNLTIWASWSRPTADRPDAPWPDRSELTYEGDDRAKTGVGRFLPLPRKPGNETVCWKAREHLEPYHGIDKRGDDPPAWKINIANEIFDGDVEFLQDATRFLGSDLMAKM